MDGGGLPVPTINTIPREGTIQKGKDRVNIGDIGERINIRNIGDTLKG